MSSTRYRRQRIFPRQVSDIGAFCFVVLMIPATFVFEVNVVFPELYKGAPWTYYAHLALGTVLLVNIVGNYIGLWLTDTSTRHVILPSTIKQRWEFCASCEAVQPPRAWHCSSCGVCVLKREHHCMFVGYCVGHRNHR
jgi:palmitoyltransferase